jgi:hypothetical protein
MQQGLMKPPGLYAFTGTIDAVDHDHFIFHIRP